MPIKEKTLLDKLHQISNKFEPEVLVEKTNLLKQLSNLNKISTAGLLAYHDILLFLIAYPANKEQLLLTHKALRKISLLLKKTSVTQKAKLLNSGLPFTPYRSRFSHDMVKWLLNHPDCKIVLNKIENDWFDLNEVLKLTLPSLEKSETTAGMENEMLLDTLKIPKNRRLQFLVDELSKIEDKTYIKDHLFDGLGIYSDITSKSVNYSRSYNTIPVNEYFFHQSILKKFDYKTLLDTPVNKAVDLTDKNKTQLISTIKKTMALTDRETDPITYMDSNQVWLYEMNRGISIAIYGMYPERQLPLQSYIGYTLFKNGIPAAYGGAWLFGKRADFGINIFEPFRGGESGYIMCELLRLYRSAFNISYFEVEPYQYGLDNPDGIATGAFWFYYRFGFRPLSKELSKIAAEEYSKISADKKYRTSKKTLIRFTEDNIALNLGNEIPVKIADITNPVIKMNASKFNSNRTEAENSCVKIFLEKTGIKFPQSAHEIQVLKEVSLWAVSSGIQDSFQLEIMKQMIKAKPTDCFEYQKLVHQFFNVPRDKTAK